MRNWEIQDHHHCILHPVRC